MQATVAATNTADAGKTTHLRHGMNTVDSTPHQRRGRRQGDERPISRNRAAHRGSQRQSEHRTRGQAMAHRRDRPPPGGSRRGRGALWPRHCQARSECHRCPGRAAPGALHRGLGHHPHATRRGQDHHRHRFDPGPPAARPPRQRCATPALHGADPGHQGRCRRRRTQPGGAHGAHQPAPHRRPARCRRRPQPARGNGRQPPSPSARTAARSAADPLAACHRHQRPRAATHRAGPRRAGRRGAASGRLRDHRGLRGHGDPRPGRFTGRPAPAPGPYRGRL